MKIIPVEKCPYIVIAGAWNPKIFTPFWLRSQEITKLDEVGVELTFGAADYQFLMKFDGIILSISDSHLVLSLSEWNQSKLAALENVALTILKSLQHTPLRAIGANFGFKIEDPTTAILNLFKVTSDEELNKINYATSKLTIAHTFAIPDVSDEVELRFCSNAEGHEVTININKKTTKADEAILWLEGNFVKFHESGMKVLSAYDLRP